MFNLAGVIAGVNIVATIHQPRQEIFELINSLLLLAPGGRTVYCGPAYAFKEHMSKLGFEPMSPATNIADFGMDVLAGFVPRVSRSAPDNVKETIEYLCSWWDTNKFEEHQTFLSNQKETIARRMNRLKTLSDKKNKRLDNPEDVRVVQEVTEMKRVEKSIRNWVRDSILSSTSIKALFCCFQRQRRVWNILFLLTLISY